MTSEKYHFIFIDIVGLSHPALDNKEQVEKIKKLTQFIKDCDTYENKKIALPTGDGVAIGFTDKIQSPFILAKELHKKINDYNKGKKWGKQIQLHIGLHSEEVIPFTDIIDRENVWGNGIIKARRIMDKSPPGFILLTEEMGEKLAEKPEYKEIIYHAGYVDLKHNQEQFVWYAYDDDFGRNDISEMKDLNNRMRPINFSAEIDKTKCKLGDTVNVKIDFTGKLEKGFCTVMLRAPKGEKFPKRKIILKGKKNVWHAFKETYDRYTDQGKLDEGYITKRFELDIPIKQNYPLGEYTMYIRVYDELKENRRPVIAEKIKTLYVE